jgi:hypothetical protein
MAVVMFCDKCFGEVREYSPIALTIWTQGCLMCAKVKRPLHMDEFRHFMWEWNGIKKTSMDLNLRVLESCGYVVTHEVFNDVWMFPMHMEKDGFGVVTVCQKNHLQ